MVKRRQPLLLIITHAGDDDESICYEEYELAKAILSGTYPDERCLPVIFEAASGDDWTDPALWARVNPGHGITIQHEGIATEAREAQQEPRKLNDFLRFHLNRWVNQATAWIPIDWWDGCQDALPSDETLATMPCALGIDLAQKIDLAAVCAVWRLPLVDAPLDTPVEIVATDEAGNVIARRLSLNYRIAILPAFWLPEETLRERVQQDRVPYDLWRSQGLLHVTEGAVIDADAMLRYIRALAERFPLLKQGEVGYDPAFATELRHPADRRRLPAGRAPAELQAVQRGLAGLRGAGESAARGPRRPPAAALERRKRRRQTRRRRADPAGQAAPAGQADRRDRGDHHGAQPAHGAGAADPAGVLRDVCDLRPCPTNPAPRRRLAPSQSSCRRSSVAGCRPRPGGTARR